MLVKMAVLAVVEMALTILQLAVLQHLGKAIMAEIITDVQAVLIRVAVAVAREP
jgi:hypothetical protein